MKVAYLKVYFSVYSFGAIRIRLDMFRTVLRFNVRFNVTVLCRVRFRTIDNVQRQRDLEVSDVYLHPKKWFGMDKISCVNDFDPSVPSQNFTRARTGWIGVRARVKLVRVSKNSARLGQSKRSIIRSFFFFTKRWLYALRYPYAQFRLQSPRQYFGMFLWKHGNYHTTPCP